MSYEIDNAIFDESDNFQIIINDNLDFWLNLYNENYKLYFERRNFIINTFNDYNLNYYDNDEGYKLNDGNNLHKFPKCGINKLMQYDQQIFKYSAEKIREYRNAGNVIDENDEYYFDFINYFQTYV